MITATNESVTLATTTGTEADVQAALGLTPEAEPPAVAQKSAEAPPAEAITEEPPTSPPGDADEAQPTEEAPPSDEPPKKKSYQSRIDRLRAEATQAQLERQAALEQAAAIRHRLEELEAQRSMPPAEPAKAPVLEDFATHEDWVAATVEHRAREIAREEVAKLAARVEADRARVEAMTAYQSRLAAARSELPNFDAVVSQEIPISRPVVDYITTQDDGPRLAYYLGQHPEDAARLSAIPPDSPFALGRAIGELLTRLDGAVSGPSSTAASRSSAPAPIKPVGGAPTAATVPLDQLDFAEYKRIRDRQEFERRQSRR